uniref:Hippocampus abundant transcript 1 protein n=1 Tax=Leptobrachium leishanense TaxID=445787 RepID=A0A8C5LQX2_9ANUR
MTGEKKKKKRLNRSILLAKKIIIKDGGTRQGVGEPSVYHAVVVIFLEFFAWGLLTTPMLTVLHQTFPQHTFLMNGLIHGVKGLLSFLSAPLIGALSDVWGRKSFLLLTVFFTCAPIPLLKISPWWYFAVISMSGVFAVTFSVIFAYVADITQEHERSTAYGLVSATFAASLVTSPAIGAYLSRVYSDTLVVVLASGVALLDIGFILLAVPESLPEEMRPVSWGAPISWEQADPFASLRKVGQDSTVLLICITVFLSYLPEAGQYSSFFLYLRQVIGFTSETVAAFIGVVGILSILAQTVVLGVLMRSIGNKNTILLGLGFQILQLAWYGFGSQQWMMWAAGAVAAMSSITFPAISAIVSRNADPDQQGVVQGMVTGIRGLCNGLGPALYGFVFYLFHVELNEMADVDPADKGHKAEMANPSDERSIIPGPPFLFGACSVLLSLLVALFIPEHSSLMLRTGAHKKHSNGAQSHALLPPAHLPEAQPILTLLPEDPVVPLGGTIQLNCSISCPNGSTTWKGLDTNLAGLTSHPGHSLLTIENVRISMGGTRICVGSCPGAKKNFQRSVILQVYALPQSLQLTSHIEEQPPSLRCSMYGVYPLSSISLNWFRGLEKLEVASDNEELSEENEELFTLTWTLDMTEKESWVSGAMYRCEAELVIGDHVFRREGVLELENKEASSAGPTLHTTEIRRPTSTVTESPRIAPTLPFSAWRLKTTLGIQRIPNPSTASLDTQDNDSVTQRQPTATAPTGKKHGTEPGTQRGQRRTWLSATTISIKSGISSNNSLKRNRLTELNINHIVSESPFTRLSPTSPPSLFQAGDASVTISSVPQITGTTTNFFQRSSFTSSTTSPAWHTKNTQWMEGSSTEKYDPKTSQETTATESITQRHSNTPAGTKHVAQPITHRGLWRTRWSGTFPSSEFRRSTTDSVTSNPASQTTSSITHSIVLTAGSVSTTATPTEKLELVWMGFSSLGMVGSLILSLQLWRRLNRKGSFQLKQP